MGYEFASLDGRFELVHGFLRLPGSPGSGGTFLQMTLPKRGGARQDHVWQALRDVTLATAANFTELHSASITCVGT